MKRAFTLVELLVVIGVIAVLMAIIFPVMALVRERGNETVCQSNLRQMAIILKTYCSDHDGMFPDPSYIYHSRKAVEPNFPPSPMGCCWHNAYTGPGSALLLEHRELQGSLAPYLGNAKVLVCKTGARANTEKGCHNKSPIQIDVQIKESQNAREVLKSVHTAPHDPNIPLIPQYTYTMNGNLSRTLWTASLARGPESNELHPQSLRRWRVYKETQVTCSPSEVFAFGEENSWKIDRLSGRWAGSEDDSPDFGNWPMSLFEITGTLTLGGLDVMPSYRISNTPQEPYASQVPATAAGDAFATYHHPRKGDLNTGHSYVSMLDGHVERIAASDQFRKSRLVEGQPASRLGPGGNLHLAWPLSVPPIAGWENQ